MFDEKNSDAFQALKKLCPDLKIDKKYVRPGEISCDGLCGINGRHVAFYAKSEQARFEATLCLAVKAFDMLDVYIVKAKEKICQDFLPVYLMNRDENIEPELSEEAFKEKLIVADIGVFYENVLSLGFCDGGMFGGHVLWANSLDKGETFIETEM